MDLLLFILALGASLVEAQFSAARDFWPASYPLAVRSPYLNTWITGQNLTSNLVNWPTQWDLASINGWSGMVRVDSVVFNWLGKPGNFNATVLQRSEVTPTRSIFAVVAGPVLLNITFLSPIEPSDLVKQSLPFSYLSVDVTSLDGKAHAVELYSDISAEWISGDRNNRAVWTTAHTESSVYHQATRQVPDSMQESANIAEDSIVYYGMKSSPGLSFQSGQDTVVRTQFGSQGKLTGAQDTEFRQIQNNYVVFGLSVDLGTISATDSPLVWAVGLVRDPVIEFATDFTGTQSRSSFFWTQFSSISVAIDGFLDDFPNALKRAVALDQQIMGAAQQISSDYVDLVSLAARQTIAGTDFTVSRTATGGWNMSDIKAFTKDIGGSRRVNAVETLYAALPTYLYLNASWVGLLLEPLLQYQASSSIYGNSFAAPDLGPSYPQAVGNSDTSAVQSLEDSSDMLVMAWAHATFSGDGTLIARYYNLLKTWADYLVLNSLRPNGQTVDGLNKPDMTNLAIKGIIAIQAMATISKTVGHSADAAHYFSTALSYANQWKTLASSSGRIGSTYDPSSSSALIYNLFGDKLFKFGLVDDATYAAQTAFYTSEFAGAAKFGLPFDGDSSFAKAPWTLFTAATVNSSSARDALVSMARLRASYNATPGAFPTVYDVNTGDTKTAAANGQASPALGAVMSILALTMRYQTIIVPPSSGGSGSPKPAVSSKKNKTAVVAGAVVASIMVLLFIFLALFLRRRRRQRAYAPKSDTVPVPFFNGLVSWSYPGETPETTESISSPITRKGHSLRVPEPVEIARGPSVRLGSSDPEAQLLRQLILEVAELRAERTYDGAPPPPFSE